MTKYRLILGLMVATVAAWPIIANAQTANSSSGGGAVPQAYAYKPELALEYNYVHSNAPPGDCGCISLNGGSATGAYPLGMGGWAVAGDVHISHGNTGSAGGDIGFTLTTFTGGIRYSPRWKSGRVRPFAQALAGGGYVSASGASGSSGAFASNLGGGVDFAVGPHLSVRAVEADYLLTTFSNGGNDVQNSLRIGTGLVFRFGGGK